MHYSYTCAALFAATALAGPISLRSNEGGVAGDIGAGVLALRNGDPTGAKNARSHEGLVGDIGVSAHVLDNGDIIGVKNAKRESVDEDTENTIGEEADKAENELGEEGDNVEGVARKSDNDDFNLISDIGIAMEDLGKGDVSGIENADDSGRKSLIGDLDQPLEVLSDAKFLGPKRSSPEGENFESADRLIDISLLGKGNPDGKYYSDGSISIKRDENAQDDFIGPFEIGIPVIDVHNP